MLTLLLSYASYLSQPQEVLHVIKNTGVDDSKVIHSDKNNLSLFYAYCYLEMPRYGYFKILSPS